jgi:Mn2+/Fe2+ NRAMP family transporter
MKFFSKAALGILTSIGGYLEVGSTGTAIQAGAMFRFQLLWALALGTIAVAFLVEMSGRLAAVSRHTLAAAVRERFGVHFDLFPLIAQLVVDYLVLASEIAGIALAAHLLTGIGLPWWALPVSGVAWLILWKGTFSVVESGTAILGLVTLSFVVAAVCLRPDAPELARGLLPSWPQHDAPHYGFLAVSIIGATVSPYMVTFYSSGAVEDQWDESQLRQNAIVSGVGMGFGSMVAASVLVVAALVFEPQGIRITRYEQAAGMLVPVFGSWGRPLFAAALGIGCLGAALELSLDASYLVAQKLGWNWSENAKPAEAARFSLVYTVLLALASVPTLLGVEALGLTNASMAASVLVLPFLTIPMLVIMNDRRYLREHVNGRMANAAVVLVVVLSFALALVSIPLEMFGG